MAILLVKIENTDSLPLNEFFDFNGSCYAVSRARDAQGDTGLDFSDFFEASVNTNELKDISVIFAFEKDGKHNVAGWYTKATIYKKIQRPSLFLEGNIIANSSDTVLLPKSKQDFEVNFTERRKLYEVIEVEDSRYQALIKLIFNYEGENEMVRYPFAEANLIPSAIKSIEACNEACEFYAGRILNNSCNSLLEIKLLEKYGKKLSEMDAKSADGYYYLAMAQCQLGFEKKAIKAIEKALKIEPEASDILAQKGIILCSMGYDLAAADCFEEAYKKSHDEQYLLLLGRAYLRAGEVDKGYECLKKIEDPSILDEAGIRLSDMEKKWSLAELGKTIFRGKK